jgi:hypothetical protein
MAEPTNFLIGPGFRRKLESTIQRVDALAPGGPVTRIKTVIEGDGGTPAPKTFRICTFTGSWAIDATKTVTFRNVTTTPNTVTVVNLFTTFSASTATTTCAIAKDGTAWYLVAPTGITPKTVTTTVLTSVSLGTAGLQFTSMNIKILETVSSSVITIGTTACA